MPYELLPVKKETYNANKILEIAEKIKQMPRPLLIHAFLSKSPQTDAFITAYKTGLPPLSADLFERFMQRGTTELIAPNVLIGQTPPKKNLKVIYILKESGTSFILVITGLHLQFMIN